ncbi:hypothetical protein ADU59_11100 [Pararhizobium polonicum]|uniref:Uncharacterized protein n=1 Tax=Pararhizobium polonicum TaxID=1612624 RepID=A0A1C7P1I0_9HYPH|nr:hypothetical protein ADU59_11100 [Pararhizobium polonicum]
MQAHRFHLFAWNPNVTILSFTPEVVNFGPNLLLRDREFILRLTLAFMKLISVYVYFGRVLIAEDFEDRRLELCL